MKVTRQTPEPVQTITIHEISTDLAEKIMALLWVVESHDNDEISQVYKGLQDVLGKIKYEPSIYDVDNINSISFTKRS